MRDPSSGDVWVRRAGRGAPSWAACSRCRPTGGGRDPASAASGRGSDLRARFANFSARGVRVDCPNLVTGRWSRLHLAGSRQRAQKDRKTAALKRAQSYANGYQKRPRR
eukprot:6204850-Pleurochrysis_carterae.AAC.2